MSFHQYPSGLRQRRSVQPMPSDTAEFTGNHNSIDERTILKLFGRPTLSSCMYRASDFLSFLYQCLTSIGPKLFIVIAFPAAIVFFVAYATERFNALMGTDKPNNQKVLQFNFIVICSCYSLIFFVVAVDYYKILSISRTAIAIRRQQHSQQKAIAAETVSESRHKITTQELHKIAVHGQIVNETPELNDGDAEEPNYATSSRLTVDREAELQSNSAVQPISEQRSNSEELSTWWGSYSILRLNLHCFIYQVKSTFKLMLSPNRRRKNSHRRRRTHGLNHYLLQLVKGNFARLSIGLILLVIASCTLVGLKKFHNRPAKSQRSDWLIKRAWWNGSLAGYLTLHFVTLIAVAAVVSKTPSKINILRIISRWLLALVACITIKLAVLPEMHPVPKCTSVEKVDNGFFAVFTDLETYIDTPVINSIGVSRPKVLFLLGSLVTAITAAFLYQLTVLQMAIGSVGTTFEFLLGVSPIEGAALLLNLFATQTNFLLLFMPFLAKMSESELFCILVLMLVKTPSEDDEYWTYKGASMSVENPSYFNRKVHVTTQSTYTPQRLAVRSLLIFPLITLFCRVLYPSGGKISARSSQFRQLSSMKDSRPFASMGESLLFFVSYCLRSLCRYFVMIMFFHCVEYLFRFVGNSIDFEIGYRNKTESAVLELSGAFISPLTDLTEFYPSKGYRLSGYIVRKFFYPKTSFQSIFVLDDYLRMNRLPDPYLDEYHELSAPIKEIVVSGSFSWDTIIIFVAFTTDFLTKDRKTSIGFIIRGCLTAVLIYAAMQNLLYLTCDDASLKKLYNISSEWIKTIDRSASLPIRECS
ncbi:hypothetical protein BOX15_Mlig008098g2 [Macrostomum lignano]|uniref:Uncharacterized protein n=1 Tax=Macrostomum lignano TaxID=282301 RepID=A0A267EBP1_9PLAT|nr:hypothetical protein BOX15_Mlig008098g2 [Macrostomum lignano]